MPVATVNLVESEVARRVAEFQAEFGAAPVHVALGEKAYAAVCASPRGLKLVCGTLLFDATTKCLRDWALPPLAIVPRAGG